MSAAVKLKALEDRRARATSQGDDWVFDPEAHRVVASSLAAALPQIVALVKVLECPHSDPDNSGRCIKCQATLDEGQPWDDALAALDGSLGEQA